MRRIKKWWYLVAFLFLSCIAKGQTQEEQVFVTTRLIQNYRYLKGHSLSERVTLNLKSFRKNRYKVRLKLQPQETESLLDVLNFTGTTLGDQVVKLDLKDNIFILRTSDLASEDPSVNLRLINKTLINKILKP